MIQSQELRIGNLVTDEYYDSFKTIIEVESVNDKGINLEIEDDGNWSEIAQRWIEPYYRFDQLRGIPLTEEWLLKFRNSIFNNGYEYKITSTGRFEIWLGISLVTIIEYLHEYQNLNFALLGEELIYKEDI